jgi:hypothetical protein
MKKIQKQKKKTNRNPTKQWSAEEKTKKKRENWNQKSEILENFLYSKKNKTHVTCAKHLGTDIT